MTKSMMKATVCFGATFMVCIFARNSSFTMDNVVIKCNIDPFIHKIGINSPQPLLQ